MGTKLETVFRANGSVFLDPDECGSVIQWHVRTTAQAPNAPDYPKNGTAGVSGEIVLSDCSRLIRWSLSDPEPLAKLDRAIGCLRTARRALSAALRAEKKARKQLGIKGD